jgi:hypothetical protein
MEVGGKNKNVQYHVWYVRKALDEGYIPYTQG